MDDIPLIVQDRKFDANGQLVYQKTGANGNLPAPAGMLGDTILVNGTRAPYVEVPPKLIRLRLVNGSDGRRYDFGFADHRAFYQIATDGGLLDTPVARTDLLLAPGERAEILVDLKGATAPLTLLSYPIDDHKNVFLGAASGVFGKDDEHQQFKILELRPQAGTAAAQADSGNAQQHQEPECRPRHHHSPVRAGLVDDQQQGDGSHAGGCGGEKGRYRNLGDPEPVAASITRSIFTACNSWCWPATARAAPAYEQGWKDTVIVHPAETVRLIMQFNDYADPHVPYMFHCHILEHEDKGMMGQFVVVDNLSDPVSIQSPLEDHQH